MAKFILLLIGLVTMGFSTPTANVTNNTTDYEQVVMASTRTIPVYYLKQIRGDVWATTEATGEYNPDYGEYGEITIKGMTYTVHLNLAYGQERDARAPYRYEAAGYYFNL